MSATDASASADRVEHPHPGWWIGVLGGLTLLAFEGFHAGFYEWWVATVHPLPPRAVMAGIFLACIPIHIAEAIYAWRTAKRLGMERSALGWTLQCFFLGWPSTSLLRKRALATAA